MMKISGLCEVTEMKTYTKPPSGLQLVLASYIWLLVGRYEHVRSNPAARIPISHDWNTCKYMISSASHFMVALK